VSERLVGAEFLLVVVEPVAALVLEPVGVLEVPLPLERCKAGETEAEDFGGLGHKLS